MSNKVGISISTNRKFTAKNIFLVYVLLFSLPYLVPEQFFLYKKVFSFPVHIAISIILFVVGWSAISLGGTIGQSIHLKFSQKVIKSSKFLYQSSRLFITISTIANFVLALYIYKVGVGSQDDLNLLDTKSAAAEQFGGFTFFTQLYLFFLPFYIKYSVENKLSWKWKVLLLGVSLLVRSFFYGERVAIMEYTVFTIVTLEYLSIIKISYKKIMLFMSVFIVFFIGAELSRQFYVQYVLTNSDIDTGFALQWAIERYAAYYSDTTNKFYLVLQDGLFFNTSFYLHFFGQIFSKFGIQVSSGDFNLQAYGVSHDYVFNDFNNSGGITMFFLDFGYWAILLFVFIFLLFGMIHKFYVKRQGVFSLCVYPSFALMVLDFPRVFYFYDTRILIPFMFFLAVIIVNMLVNRKEVQPIS